MSKARRMSAEQFLSGPSEDFKSELIYGEKLMCPRPSDQHQDLLHDLGELLKRWARAAKLGKVSYDIDMVLDELKDLVYAPDLLFVLRQNEQRRREGRLYGPADLCVEILSPSDNARVRRRKFTDYERYGVPWYWIINPETQTLEENELVEGVYACRTEVGGDDWFEPGLFPGLQFRLAPLLDGDLKAAVRGKAKRLV
jgi:Uma2 family endonuclease